MRRIASQHVARLSQISASANVLKRICCNTTEFLCTRTRLNCTSRKRYKLRHRSKSSSFSIILRSPRPAARCWTVSSAKGAADVDVHRDEWTFVELEHPKCRSEALELAKNCDMLVIAISENDLSASFIDWLDEWALSRDHCDAAMILLLASTTADISALPRCAAIPPFARRHGLAFFATVLTPSGSTIPRFLHPKALLARLAVLDTELLPDFSGINE
ncbi:MAG TPA: hypothetical protein VM680_00255 [Verrucomicrobiae bacterium]|nr:hypothetical protein [Verrucomicrobiae bacterium]